MSELKKMRQLVLWLRVLESAYIWRSIIEKLTYEFNQTPITQRQPIIEQKKSFERMLGSCMALLTGVYELESALWWDDDLENDHV